MSDAEQIFMCCHVLSCVICMSSLETRLFRFFPRLFDWVFFFFSGIELYELLACFGN